MPAGRYRDRFGGFLVDTRHATEGWKNGFVAEVVRLPTCCELTARILTNSATSFLVGLRSLCKPVLTPATEGGTKFVLVEGLSK